MYHEIGGKEVIHRLVTDFYQIMSTDPKASKCFATHAGRDLQETSIKLEYFLNGWLGGPQLYLEKYGHPRLRMRHFPFSIGREEAQEWLYCMELALKKSTISQEYQSQMMTAFAQVCQMIINRP